MEIISAERSSTDSLKNEGKQLNGRWTKEEHQRFVEAIKNYGKNWKKIEELVATRNGSQIRSHAQKFFIRLEKEVMNKPTNQKGKSDRTLVQSLRKFSGASISTHHSQEENHSDFEKPNEQLRENLPLKETNDELHENPAIPKLDTIEEVSKESMASKGTKKSQKKKGAIEKCVQKEELKKSERAELSSSVLPSKLGSAEEKLQEANSLVKKLFILSGGNFPTDTSTNTSTTSIRTPIVGKVYPHQSLYFDLMNYLSRFNKTSKNLKLSDFVDFQNRKHTEDQDSYEFPPSGKKLKQL